MGNTLSPHSKYYWKVQNTNYLDFVNYSELCRNAENIKCLASYQNGLLNMCALTGSAAVFNSAERITHSPFEPEVVGTHSKTQCAQLLSLFSQS